MKTFLAVYTGTKAGMEKWKEMDEAKRKDREKAGMVYGWVFMCHQLGGASAAFFAGLFRESFGGYMQAFMLSGLLCLFAAVAALFIGGVRPAPTPVAATA